MTPKEYLQQAYKLDRRINITLRKAEKLRSALEYKSPGFDGGGSGGNTDRMAETLAKVVEYEENAKRLREMYIEKYIEIEKAIQTVSDGAQREILERRYLLYQPWESRTDERTGEITRGIAEEMGYSRRRIFQLHGEALKKISVPCKDCTGFH